MNKAQAQRRLVTRAVAFLLSAVMLMSFFPISVFAAAKDDIPPEMLNSRIMEALAYTGYKVQKQIDDGTIFQSGSYGINTPSGVLSGIKYSLDLYGWDTKNDSSTPTGKAPNIAKFKTYGLCCAGFVTYYLLNYLPNIVGVDNSFIRTAINGVGTNPQAVSTWRTALNRLSNDPNETRVSKIGTSKDNVDRTQLVIGDIITFGSSSNSNVHIAVYAGTYNGIDWIIHVANNRGPEISRVDWMTTASDGKASSPNGYYHLEPSVANPYGHIEINKTSTDGTPLAGAVFRAVKNDEPTKWALIGPTDASGYAKTSEEIPHGTYTVTETTFPTNYHAVNGVSSWTVTLDNLTTNLATLNVQNEADPGDLRIVKTSEDGNVAGVEFTVVGGDVNTTVTTGEDGTVTLTDLKPIEYTVTETVGVMYQAQSPQTVTVASNTVTDINFHNLMRQEDMPIKIIKRDTETGLVIPVAGTGFQIHRADGTLITMTVSGETVDTFFTDSDGTLVTPDKLPNGTGYYLVETTAPNGYVLDGTPVYFDVRGINSRLVSEDSTDLIVDVTQSDTAQKGTITVELTGKGLVGIDTANDGTNTFYTPVYDTVPLADVEFEITAKTDITTADGTTRYIEGQVVATVTTGEDGTVTTEPLYLGDYIVTQKAVPEGYLSDDTNPHEVSLTYTDPTVTVFNENTEFFNPRQEASLSFGNIMETDSVYDIGFGSELYAVKYGVYAAQEIEALNGQVIPQNGLIELMVPNAAAECSVITDLPIGSYYIKQLETDEHYIIHTEEFPFEFEYAGADTAEVELSINEGEDIFHEIIYGTVIGVCKTENDELLEGALVGIFDKPSGEETDPIFTADTARVTVVSDEDGEFSFGKVPYGDWVVREITPPEGFTIDDHITDTSIRVVDEIKEVLLIHNYIIGSIELKKLDSDYVELDEPMSGATFEVWLDMNENGQVDEEIDTLMGELVRNEETGLYEMDNLYYGHYLVVETTAPDGFKADTNAYPIFIDTDETVYKVENQTGVGFINVPMKGTLKIVKTSSDGKVEGFSFRITGVWETDITLTTDENGEILIEGLRIGEYTIEEIEDEASNPYIKPAAKQAMIYEDAETTVEIFNKRIPVPNTGDETNVPMYIAIMSVSLVVIAVLCPTKKSNKRYE